MRLPIGLYSDDPVATAYEEAATPKDKCLVVLAHAPDVTAEEQWDTWCEGFGVDSDEDEQHAIERLTWNVGMLIRENTESVENTDPGGRRTDWGRPGSCRGRAASGVSGSRPDQGRADQERSP